MAAARELGDGQLALLEEPGLRVDDAVVQRRPPSGCDSTKMQRSSPSSKPHCSCTGASSCSWCRWPSPKFQPRTRPGDDLAVEPLVVLEAVDRLRHQERQRAPVQVHQAKAHHLAEQAHARSTRS